MGRRRRRRAVILLSALWLAAAQQTIASPVVGDWTNPAQSVVMQVAPCGPALCGTVRWASEPARNDAGRGGTQTLVGRRFCGTSSPCGQASGAVSCLCQTAMSGRAQN